MHISKFLLIDAALTIAVISLFYLLQRGKTSFFKSSKQEGALKKTLYKLPNKQKLLELEKIALDSGSGIEFDSLVGDWRFVSVWAKDTDEGDSIFCSLLRFFAANLTLKKDFATKNAHKFSISASIQFGLFTIEFSGSGFLKGKQPYLPFFFNLIKFKSGSRILFSNSLEEPVDKKKSFFQLIASGRSGEWLSARGQSGALVLWLKN